MKFLWQIRLEGNSWRVQESKTYMELVVVWQYAKAINLKMIYFKDCREVRTWMCKKWLNFYRASCSSIVENFFCYSCLTGTRWCILLRIRLSSTDGSWMPNILKNTYLVITFRFISFSREYMPPSSSERLFDLPMHSKLLHKWFTISSSILTTGQIKNLFLQVL